MTRSLTIAETASDTTIAPTHLARLTNFLATLDLEQLPKASVYALKLSALDTFGCMIGGLATASAPVMSRFQESFSGSGSASVTGSSNSAAPDLAALVNGTLGHALIFDDMHRHAKLHPGVITLPAVLAVAEHAGASGRQALAALAAGYETCARVGVAVDLTAHRMAGWRASGTAGSIGAAAAVGRLLGLSADALHQAVAAGTAQASGTFAFQESGGMELYFHPGMAARNGVTAGFLAQAGWRGSAAPLEAADGGYLAAVSNAPHPEALSAELGTVFRLSDVCIKRHPTCHSTQSGIDAALILRTDHGIRPRDVERVVVEAGEITRIQCGWPFRVAAPELMIFHMGFAIALALEAGQLLPSDFEGDRLHDPELVRLAKATEVKSVPELTAMYKEKKPSIVSLHLKDGRIVKQRVDFCQGEPENPSTFEAVYAKFRALSAPFMATSDMERMAQIVLNIEQAPSLAEVGAMLRRAARQK